jgi:hypothetical protein
MTTRILGVLVLLGAPAALAYWAGFNEAAHYVGLGALLALQLSLLARPVAQKWQGDMTYEVTDTGRPPGNGVRPDKTNAEQNFHTDNSYNLCPPDVVSLFCVRKSWMTDAEMRRVRRMMTDAKAAGVAMELIEAAPGYFGFVEDSRAGAFDIGTFSRVIE